jgi:hypothetical protein
MLPWVINAMILTESQNDVLSISHLPLHRSDAKLWMAGPLQLPRTSSSFLSGSLGGFHRMQKTFAARAEGFNFGAWHAILQDLQLILLRHETTLTKGQGSIQNKFLSKTARCTFG